MNILHIISRFDSYDAIQSALELSRHLNINGLNSIVASSLDEKGLGNISSSLEYHKLPNFERNVKYLFVGYYILKNIVMSEKIDIVHIHSLSSMWLGFLICRNTQSRLALSCYNFHRKNISSERLILADKIIAHNQAVGKQLISDFNLSSHKVQFINPGIDTDNFSFQGIDERSKTDFTIGVIPSLMPETGYEYFLKAMVKVTRIIPYVNISILISPFHSRKNIQEDLGFWTRRLGLSNYVKFIDISNLDTKFLTRFNLLVYAPIAENALTRIILEAQAYGVPVIAGHVAGMLQAIQDNKTGVLIPPKDNSSLATAIVKVLKEFSFTREITLMARKRIEEESNIDKNISHFVETYKELKSKKRVLVVSLGNANETVSAIPALSLLRNNIAGAQISVLIKPRERCLLQRCPYIDELIVYDVCGKKYLRSIIGIIKSLIEKRFHIVFDLHNTLGSQAISYLSLANQRYGYRNRILGFIVNNNMERPNKFPGELIQEKISILGLKDIEAQDYKLELWPSQEDEDFVEEFFQNNWFGKERVAVIDICFERISLKGKQILNGLLYLCNNLTKQHIRIVLVGSKASLKIKDELFNKINPKSVAFIKDISYNQMACFIKRSQIYISFHQDFIYIALAAKTPALVISDDNVNQLLTLKNVATLALRDIPLSNKRSRRKNRLADMVEEKDVVMQMIDKLLGTK